MHFNYRYFETDEWRGVPGQWWFGGGTDITPSYLYKEDMEHFHGAYKAVCDAHDPAFYPKFKNWCDDYFLIKHRGERRGLGGIFFDDLNDRAPEELLKFSTQAMNSVVDSYLPIVARRKDAAFTEEQRQWQQLRRGRCVGVGLGGWGSGYLFACFLCLILIYSNSVRA
jgi:coproporphyrinogen III oxidase